MWHRTSIWNGLTGVFRNRSRSSNGLPSEIVLPRSLTTGNSAGGPQTSSEIAQIPDSSPIDGRIGYTDDGGIKYAGFVYYPRYPGQKDATYTPSMVHMVQRVRCLKKKPYWEKDIMKHMGLDGKRSDIAVVANTPAMNKMLWDVKHLVRITPVTFPQGLPQDGDLRGAKLLEDGRLIFSPLLKNDTEQLKTSSAVEETKKMDGKTLAKHLRLKWIQPFH
nr:EOG090X0EYV [Lepidurus arcticus]